MASAINRPLVIILATVCLDAAGIGLIFPILPRLLEAVTHSEDIALHVGLIATLYAAVQFLFAPVLGALSDNIGRRPVLLISLTGAAINYLVMAFATQLWLLLLGRAIAGLTSANVSVATAYLTDITPAEKRPGRFGLLNAMFGIGFIIGPVLGGLLGDYSLRLPFIAAAVLNAGNFLFALLVLPESGTQLNRQIDIAALNPLRPLLWVLSMKALFPVIFVYFILSAAGEAYGTCWALWGFDAFKWNGLWVGLSLGTFGVCQTLVQALLPDLATKMFGERWAVLFGLACACTALTGMAFADEGWMVFAIMPIFALGSIGTPTFQALATRHVDQARQGQLQGVLTSAVSLASIIAPLSFSTVYFIVRNGWPGAIWLSVAGLNAIAVPLVILGTRSDRSMPSCRRARSRAHSQS